MSRFSFTVFLLGLTSFFFDFSYGLGWTLGWIFITLLEYNREKFLDRLLNLDDFSMGKYIAYLIGVIIWVAAPLLLSFVIPNYLNPFAVFAAYFSSRFIMFISKAFVKEER
ncbi:MAG: hypothetical protein L0L39_01710 [Atopostipes suicloacalis]|nr:hypothetical protein [Atopostipes suicloacalis]